MNTTTIQKRNILIALINQIDAGVIKQFYGFKVKEPRVKSISHFFTYIGKGEDGNYYFILTMKSIGYVKIVDQIELLDLAIEYDFEIIETIPFQGDAKAAMARVEEVKGRKYAWVFCNCENLMHYIQTGKSKSNQTRTIAGGTALVGSAMMCSKNKTVRTIGAFATFAGLFVFLVEIFTENKF